MINGYIIVLCLLISFSCWGQNKIITGKVTSNDDGTVLPGVNVVIKGTTQGTVTDAEGKYSIEVDNHDVLVFSFIGLETQSINVGNKSVINVHLSSDITQLSRLLYEKASIKLTE